MSRPKVSVVLPVYLPTDKHKQMTDQCIYLAKDNVSMPVEWVIVETCSYYYKEEADVYIHEDLRTSPNKSINHGFKAASGEYIIFLANDVFVNGPWIEAMLECFDKNNDCAVASLGTKEFGDVRKDEIIEGIYFSVAMMKKKDAWLDPDYDDLFDDSDLLMRVLARGDKCYRNMSVVVTHLNHATYGAPDLTSDKNIRQRNIFKDKWKGFKDHPAYKLFIPEEV